MNVILSFLSPLHLIKNQATGDMKVKLVEYPAIAEDGLGLTHTTNESGLRYVLQKIGPAAKLDAYIALLSNKVEAEKLTCLQPAQTHKQYFVTRADTILKAYQQEKGAAEIMEYIDFDEKGTREDAVKAVTEAVHMINILRKDEHGQAREVNVYLDISGGMRDSNMLILIISRILGSNEGIKIQEVIYSNYSQDTNTGKVETMTAVYGLLDLVAGVNEFINFGSMKSLNAYFAQATVRVNVGPELEALLQAMTDFTEKVQLCRSTIFDEAICALKAKLLAFEEYYENSGKNITEKLFSGLLENIHKKYDVLFAVQQVPAKKYIQYISWCHENGYLQQSLTMITETFPEICFGGEDALLHFSGAAKEEELREQFAAVKENEYDEFGSWLLFNYRYVTKQKCYYHDLNDVQREINRIIVKLVIEPLRKKTYDPEKIQQAIADLNKKAVIFGHYDSASCLEHTRAFAQYVLENPRCSLTEADTTVPVFAYLAAEGLVQQCSGKVANVAGLLKKLLPGSGSLPIADFGKLMGCEFIPYVGNTYTVLSLLTDGVLVSSKPHMQEILINYYALKEERNAANHANRGRNAATGYRELKSKIDSFIELIK